MHPDISKLLEVQKVDVELARIKRDLKSLPEEDARRKRDLDQARQAAEASRHESDLAQVRSREAENSIRSADDEIKKLEARLNGVKNNAEYQATLFQIESVRRERGALEEEGLSLLDRLEGLRAAATEAAERFAAAEKTYQEFQAKAAALREERDVELAEVGRGRDALVADIPPDLLQKYTSVLEFRDGMAVCVVEGQHCTGCYTSVTPNDMARLAGASSIVQCGSCQRLLYLPES